MYYSNLLNKEITLDIARDQLKSTWSMSKDQSMSIDSIIRVVAEYFNISPYDIKGKKRTKSVVLPRQIAMYIARAITDYSTTEIGYEFGGRDHTTVMHSVQRIEALVQSDIAVNNSIQNLTRQAQTYKRDK
jgi:chromosomal replication initiator protein